MASFGQISLQKLGNALSGTFDGMEQILQRLAGFEPLILEITLQKIGVGSCHGCRI